MLCDATCVAILTRDPPLGCQCHCVHHGTQSDEEGAAEDADEEGRLAAEDKGRAAAEKAAEKSRLAAEDSGHEVAGEADEKDSEEKAECCDRWLAPSARDRVHLREHDPRRAARRGVALGGLMAAVGARRST